MPVTLKGFAKHVSKLFIKPVRTYAGVMDIQRILHAVVGVGGESGELLDCVKKTWIYDKELDIVNLKEEVGDSMFYLQAIANECDFTLQECMDMNVVKLKSRYPNGYTDRAALERADKV